MASARGLALAHLFGDYVLQSDWMANEKTKRWPPALIHAAVYAACHLPVTRSPWRLAVIAGTHAVIDHYRLARHIGWAKNRLAPRSTWRPWAECSTTGYAPDKPDWMAVWLMIIVDNAVHLAINAVAASDR